jgi:hypothetical protein
MVEMRFTLTCDLMKHHDPLLKEIEAFTGHTAARREAARMLITLIGGLLIAALALILTSCMTASGAGWKTTAIGTDASKYKVTAEGIEVTDLNQTKGLGKVLSAVEKMWRNYLVTVGLKYVAGKYYDYQNNLATQDTTLKLEQLRNAKSVADAEAALATLKATQAAEAAAAGAAVL